MKDSVIVLPEASPYYWSIGLDTIDTNIIEPDTNIIEPDLYIYRQLASLHEVSFTPYLSTGSVLKPFCALSGQ